MRRPRVALGVLASFAREALLVRPRCVSGGGRGALILRCITPIMPADVDTKRTFFDMFFMLPARGGVLRGQLFQRLPLTA